MSSAAGNRQYCAATRKDGQPCRALATATGLCIAHSPESNAWRAKGGSARGSRERAARLLPSRLRPIAESLERAFAAVEKGEMEPRVATALAALAGAYVKVCQSGELEERLRNLEQSAVRVLTGKGAA